MDQWINDFEQVSQNALAVEWYVSPLEYMWPDGKKILDLMFRSGGSPSQGFDVMITSDLFLNSMQIDFRSKMMVLAFMREPIAKSFGLEIESGLLSLYQLDFLPCLSQWIYVIEGYCRKLFSVSSTSNVDFRRWKIPKTGYAPQDRLINTLSLSLNNYLNGIMFKSTSNFSIEILNRNLILHGNHENKGIFNQKNCLITMFLLDALVYIEMAVNGHFPSIFDDEPGDNKRITRRKHLYMSSLKHAFAGDNLLKIDILAEHI